MNIKILLGKRIKEFRRHKKLTQEQLAEFIGIEPVSLCNIENGKYYPTAENLEKIVHFLDISPKDLFDFEHHQENENLIEEINLILKDNPQRIRDIYNILKALTK